jgi:carbamoyltransferase
MITLGISGSFNYGSTDAAACLLRDGKIVGACEEERFTRVKYGAHVIPKNSMRFVLREAGLRLADVDVLAVYVSSYASFENDLKRFLRLEFGELPKRFVFVDHHLAHAASTFAGSGFSEAAVLTYDYSGDGICTGLYHGKGRDLQVVEQVPTRSGKSLGRFYALFTQYLGFYRGDEYKVMGLSAYGNREDLFDLSAVIRIGEEDFEIVPDIYHPGPHTSLEQHLFNESYLSRHLPPPRAPSDPLGPEHKKLAISVQAAFEQATMALARRLKRRTGSDRLCLAGGCALNCVSNGRLLRSGLFREVYTPPVCSDAGGAIGAAYWASMQAGEQVEPLVHAYWGPGFDDKTIHSWLRRLKVSFTEVGDVAADAAERIAAGQLVGWFQGRTEYGPRALGARSILANPRDPGMRDKINEYVKFRETFRPFAPSVMATAAGDYFEEFADSPFMNFVFDVIDPRKIPAITHVDGTARVQSVSGNANPAYHALLGSLGGKIGVPMVLNTSFNINGQPIVNTPHEAIYTFYASGLDALYLGSFRVDKQAA